ncbi:hypothetical protein ACWDX6_20690 [Streptomyces sp. NPDC003027]|uniref:hypothetical protein n=1 Tax=Streptomyces sp. NPDC093600 TaxID=3366047 RepID=UPI0038251E48
MEGNAPAGLDDDGVLAAVRFVGTVDPAFFATGHEQVGSAALAEIELGKEHHGAAGLLRQRPLRLSAPRRLSAHLGDPFLNRGIRPQESAEAAMSLLVLGNGQVKRSYGQLPGAGLRGV